MQAEFRFNNINVLALVGHVREFRCGIQVLCFGCQNSVWVCKSLQSLVLTIPVTSNLSTKWRSMSCNHTELEKEAKICQTLILLKILYEIYL